MRTRSVALLLCGSAIVHVALSCANIADHSDRQASLTDALTDVLTGGDGKAEAAPPAGWTSDEIACDKTYDYAGTKVFYAEKAYPGRPREDLAHVIVLDCGTTLVAPTSPPGFPCITRQVSVDDGRLAVTCGSAPGKVRLLVPPP